MISKEQVLSEAPEKLNDAKLPWSVDVQGDTITGTWRWRDEDFPKLTGIEVPPNELNAVGKYRVHYTGDFLSDEIKKFSYSITLEDDGKFHETWVGEAYTPQGYGGIGKGKGTPKSHGSSYTLEKDPTTGKRHFHKEGSYNVNMITQPMLDYMAECGWERRKPKLFGFK